MPRAAIVRIRRRSSPLTSDHQRLFDGRRNRCLGCWATDVAGGVVVRRDHQRAMQHVHGAGELVDAGLFWCEIDGDVLTLGQGGALSERGEDDPVSYTH